ncbi:MurR/RpiR family transcriptional regulator [Anaerovibrio sp.]|uniref:MurR/RpiR family transcriptional regulator n=1 Tax=Anaerovibrio sp. TaxID=1872532 RepID=UPI003F14C88E
MKLEELVNRHLGVLNPTDFIVWRYILSHRRECCYISIYDIASACNVSRTTVLRFAKKLGLDGFSDLKMMLKMENRQTRERPAGDIAQAATRLCHRLGEEIARQNFLYVNRLLCRARQVFVYASGHMQRNVADELIRIFIFDELYFIHVNGRDEMRHIAAHVTKEDLFIIISLSGESEHVVEFARQLRAREVPVISITRLKDNTLAGLSSASLYVSMCRLPVLHRDDTPYESMLGFFLLVEIWFVSYTQFLSEQR